jgi:hypothetical protein
MKHLKKFDDFQINENLFKFTKDAFGKALSQIKDTVKKIAGLDDKSLKKKKFQEPGQEEKVRLELAKFIEDNEESYQNYKKKEFFENGRDATKQVLIDEIDGTIDIPEIFLINQFAVDEHKKTFGLIINKDFSGDKKPILYTIVERLAEIKSNLERDAESEGSEFDRAYLSYADKYRLDYKRDWRLTFGEKFDKNFVLPFLKSMGY